MERKIVSVYSKKKRNKDILYVNKTFDVKNNDVKD